MTETYLEAKKRILKKTHDSRDEVIVALWDSTSKAIDAEATMKVALDIAQADARQYCRDNDLLASRLAKSLGTLRPAATTH